MKEMQLLIAFGLKIFRICLKIDVSKLLGEVKRPLPIVRCEQSPYDLINALGPYSVILQPRNCYQVEFTNLPYNQSIVKDSFERSVLSINDRPAKRSRRCA